MFIYIALTKL
ncbi:f19a72ee-4a25-4a92-aeb5-86cad1552375 [Thermothielavioides terrestris]|uniref:F19a72ee-4a25-4a92-aeb5-86cad1552375 n=1 Tax=Thermothielavioides terrestris TaxID=2587410 RepID=A0A446BRH8_9PEZI|nr:f19a72ee-4a25-4a92-aeb5-86cad1552375 [Thermothielavioides terrestris]